MSDQNQRHQLTDFIAVEHTEQHLYLSFSKPHQILSSAVLNGGLQRAGGVLNLKVPKQLSEFEPAEQTLSRYGADLGCEGMGCEGVGCEGVGCEGVGCEGVGCEGVGCEGVGCEGVDCGCEDADLNDKGVLVGMMTAASMASYRLACRKEQGVEIFVLATAGLSNARRAGDPAEYRRITSEPEEAGTINLMMATNACLTQAAMVESLMMITEAKAAVLQDAGIMSPVSGLIATGTGTDSVAVINGFGPEVRYCGKHVLFGELLAQAVIEAVQGAVSWDRAQL